MRVLIADDEPIHLFLLEMFLKRWGYDVTSCRSGSEAWKILQWRNSPRLAILDWQLPGKDGIEICAEVKKAGRQPYKCIILLTARALEEDILKGKEAGADDYITKPYDPDELQRRLLAACQIPRTNTKDPHKAPTVARLGI